jgi:hypothetical protein
MSKFNLYLFQPNYQGGKGQFVSQWLPYSIASVWAYSAQFDHINQQYEVKDCIFRRDTVEDVIDSLDNPSMCVFSTYIWNENYNLEVAKAVKEKYPNCLIVFGGPQVDENGIDFLARNKCVTSVVVNEGELSFYQLLTDYATTGKIKKIYSSKRIEELQLPSPYSTSIFNKIIKDNPNTRWASTIETNRGCPFGCTFCDWGSLTQNKIKKFNLEKVFLELDWISDNGIEYLYVADANFGVFYERDKNILERLVENKKRTGFPHTVNITWYKNQTDQVIELINILDEVGLNRGLTLSVQSLNDKTLSSINRKNMEISKLSKIYELCNTNNLSYYTEFILGLPEETFDSWAEGLCKAVSYGCHGNIEIFVLELLRNSELAKQATEHQFQLFHFEIVEQDQHSSIPEKHNYVVGTKYMPKSDLILSWMYGWLIVNFHSYGWTQIIAKAADKLCNKSYREVYDTLWNYIKTNNVLLPYYLNHKDNFEKFLYVDPTNLTGFQRNDDIVVNSQHKLFHANKKKIQSEINIWARELLKELPTTVVDDIIILQDLYTVDFDTTSDTVIVLMHNIPEAIDGIATLTNNRQYYNLSNIIDWTDRRDFDEKLHYKHRMGFSKRFIKAQ